MTDCYLLPDKRKYQEQAIQLEKALKEGIPLLRWRVPLFENWRDHTRGLTVFTVEAVCVIFGNVLDLRLSLSRDYFEHTPLEQVVDHVGSRVAESLADAVMTWRPKE